MSSNVEMIEVVCPKCGEEYGYWYGVDDPAETDSCPYCGHAVAGDRSLHKDGVWALTVEDEMSDR